MYKSLSVLLIAFAISTPAQADIFGVFASTGGPEQIVEDHAYGPAQSSVSDGSMHGYPFYSGCCEPQSSCCQGLWDGFCASKGCGMTSGRLRHHAHQKGGLGNGFAGGMVHGHGGFGKGGGGHAGLGGWGNKSSWGHKSFRGLGGKGSCGLGGVCGSKGGDICDPCGPKGCRLGLFDWLHFGRGHKDSDCGDVGGKGGYAGYAPIHSAPIHGYDNSYDGSPIEPRDNSSLQPPEVLVEPTPTSNRSASRRQLQTNPFWQPLSY
ncbi:MAG: hypothetical protein WD070_06615 [Pirellulaceae bacterium]